MTPFELAFELSENFNISLLLSLRDASLDGKTIAKYRSPTFVVGSGVKVEVAGMNATRFLLMPAPNTL